MKYTSKQMEAVARRMGYNGPMHKFGEFLRARPGVRRMAEGGLVNPTMAGMGREDFQNLVQTYSQGATTTPAATSTQVTPLVGTPDQSIPQGSGQIAGAAPQATAAQAGAVTAPSATPSTVTTAAFTGARGVTAPTAPQVQANTVESFLTQPGVNGLANSLTAAQGTVNKNSTVQGQMGELMKQFEGGNTPAWAAGALRNADAQMAARGLGASSMAGAATTQAAMEAALPIAAQDAQTYFAMQQQNLTNQQQVAMQRNQARIDAFFTDAAQINATRQFNASSQQQAQQFNASLRSQTEQFNAAQLNAITQFNAAQANQMTQFNTAESNANRQFNVAQTNAMNQFNASQVQTARQFNASELNAIRQFNTQIAEQRQQFNAANRLVIDQANAVWRQQIATANNANINEANRIDAQNANNLTVAQMNNLFQERRDAISFAYNASQSAQDRAMSLILAQMTADEATQQRNADTRNGMWSALGSVAAAVFNNLF